MRPAVFMDRDGTLIKDKDYLDDPAEVEWFPGTIEALKRLQQAGYLLFIVSNQSGVARGYFSEETVRKVNEKILSDLNSAGVEIAGNYYCPYHPDAKTDKYRRNLQMRKPAPGMLEKAAEEYDIDFKNSYMAGDKISDLKAGRAMNCRLILVETGKGKEARKKLSAEKITPEIIAPDFPTATSQIPHP